jgi:hypothetical protein
MSSKAADNTMKTKQKRCAYSTLHTLTLLVAVGIVLAMFAGYAGEGTGTAEARGALFVVLLFLAINIIWIADAHPPGSNKPVTNFETSSTPFVALTVKRPR